MVMSSGSGSVGCRGDGSDCGSGGGNVGGSGSGGVCGSVGSRGDGSDRGSGGGTDGFRWWRCRRRGGQSTGAKRCSGVAMPLRTPTPALPYTRPRDRPTPAHTAPH